MSDGGGDIEMNDGDFSGFTTSESNSESFCGKMKQSCTGVGIGILMFFGSFGLLIWNEGRAVSRRKDLEEGFDIVKSIRLEDFNPDVTNDGDLVHATGLLSTPSVLRDDIFGVTTGTLNGTSESGDSPLRLQRMVQMYQWREQSRSEPERVVYSYDKVWSSTRIDSSSFNNRDTKLQNPTIWPFDFQQWSSTDVFLGNRVTLSSEIIDIMNWFEPISNVEVENVPDAQLREQVSKQNSNTFFYRATTTSSPSNPEVGDMLLSWEVVHPKTISIVARIHGNQLSSFTTTRGGSLLLLQIGSRTAEDMFEEAHDENEGLAWVLRFVGFLMMFISVLLVLQPLATAVEIVPFVGDCIGDGLESCVFPCIAFTIALPLSALVISLAWIAYRPVIAVPILVASSALICFFCYRARKAQSNLQDSPEKPQVTAVAGDDEKRGPDEKKE